MYATRGEHCAFAIDGANRPSHPHNDVPVSERFRGCKRKSRGPSRTEDTHKREARLRLWAPARQPSLAVRAKAGGPG